MNYAMRIQALQAALDQANMQIIEQREVIEQAWDALKYHTEQTRPIHETNEAINALREVLGETK